MRNGIISYSGGLDSTVLLYLFREKIRMAVSFQYGSRHSEQELKCAKYHCEKLGIEHRIIALDFEKWGLKSSLLGNEDIPDGHYEDELMRSTVVPFRNGIMLSICAAIAESEKLDEIYLANHSGDHAIYPDCREKFSSAMSKAIEYGTYQKIRVMTPFVYMSKRDVALRGKSFDIDFAKTWSCYKGQKIHCGTCGTCVERKEALSGFDTTEYLR